MNKQKELFRNIVIFGIGTLGSKLMQMLLIPLYTVYMTTGQYGIADIINSTNTLISPLLTLGLGNGLLRFLLGQRENEKPATRLIITVCLTSTLVLIILTPLLSHIDFIGEYNYFVPMLFFVSSLKTYLSQICKAQEKNIVYAIDGILQTIFMSFLCVLFIAKWNWGIKGYLYSIVLANAFSVIYFSFFINLVSILKSSYLNKKLTRDMMSYSLPLIPNELSWWAIQMSDRYMVIYFCGASLNGIYSMAYKIPGIFNLLVSIFIQAFGITAIKECDLQNTIDGKVDGSFFEKLFTRYMAITFIAVVVVIQISRPLALIFMKNDFYQAWTYVPLLLVAFAIGNLQAFYGSILAGIKDTKTISKSTMAGMLVNILLNLILIPLYNAYGAAIATIVSYLVVYIVRLRGIQKSVQMNNYVIDTVISIVFIFLISALYIFNTNWTLLLSIALSILLIIYYRDIVVEGVGIFKRLCVKILS